MKPPPTSLIQKQISRVNPRDLLPLEALGQTLLKSTRAEIYDFPLAQDNVVSTSQSLSDRILSYYLPKIPLAFWAWVLNVACDSRGEFFVKCQRWPIGTVFWCETHGWRMLSFANLSNGTCMAVFLEGFWCEGPLRLPSQLHMSSGASDLSSWKLITSTSDGRYAWLVLTLLCIPRIW